MFVKLTVPDGTSRWVNADAIGFMWTSNKGTTIHSALFPPTLVKETPEQIEALVGGHKVNVPQPSSEKPKGK